VIMKEKLTVGDVFMEYEMRKKMKQHTFWELRVLLFRQTKKEKRGESDHVQSPWVIKWEGGKGN